MFGKRLDVGHLIYNAGRTYSKHNEQNIIFPYKLRKLE